MANRGSGGQRAAPAREVRLGSKHAEVVDTIEDIKVAKDWREYRVDEREAVAVEPGCRRHASLEPVEAPSKPSLLVGEACSIGRRVELGDIVEDCRAVLDEGTVLGASERIDRVQGPGLGLLQIFKDDGGFENGRAANLEDRCLAKRRKRFKPPGLVGKIDRDALACDALLRERDDGALDVGTKRVADEDEGLAHAATPWPLARSARSFSCFDAKPQDGIRAKAPSPNSA